MVASASSPHLKPPLVDFDIVQEYIIPRKAFFNRFVTVGTPDGRHRVLGFPVSIPHERYHRNEFIFNFGLVVDEADADSRRHGQMVPYERLVRRLAVTFAEMERQAAYLSSPPRGGSGGEDGGGGGGGGDDGRRPIESLLEIVKEDLNNYGECMIPVDDANTLNMKLFPPTPSPPAVRGWHVPVPKARLAALVDPATWDLTLQRLVPHVDGVNDVRRVAWLADVSLPLARAALRHLLHYDAVLLLDCFFFGACYAPRPGVRDFVANRGGIVDECAAYVCVGDDVDVAAPPAAPQPRSAGPAHHSTAAAAAAAAAGAVSATTGRSDKQEEQQHADREPGSNNYHARPSVAEEKDSSSSSGRLQTPRVSHYQLIRLMTTFCVGRSVMEWIRLHRDADGFDVLRRVDVRRLVQFGVIKGLLYRVHKYAVSKQYLAALATGQRRRRRRGGGGGDGGRGGYGGGGGGGDYGDGDDGDENDEGEDGGDEDDDEDDDESDVRRLTRYADGRHCFDQIITEQNMTDAEIMQGLKSFRPGDVSVFYR
ncbi:nitrogen permease regulator 2-domain-containing protein [Xylariaceae sp. FL0804]|nr:nitrogen permease regulator 2-domain-containing protein [Xylariaceae sp. FL0804]